MDDEYYLQQRKMLFLLYVESALRNTEVKYEAGLTITQGALCEMYITEYVIYLLLDLSKINHFNSNRKNFKSHFLTKSQKEYKNLISEISLIYIDVTKYQDKIKNAKKTRKLIYDFISTYSSEKEYCLGKFELDRDLFILEQQQIFYSYFKKDSDVTEFSKVYFLREGVSYLKSVTPLRVKLLNFIEWFAIIVTIITGTFSIIGLIEKYYL